MSSSYDGKIIRCKEDNTLHLIENGVRRQILSPSVIRRTGYNFVELPCDQVYGFPEGMPVSGSTNTYNRPVSPEVSKYISGDIPELIPANAKNYNFMEMMPPPNCNITVPSDVQLMNLAKDYYRRVYKVDIEPLEINKVNEYAQYRSQSQNNVVIADLLFNINRDGLSRKDFRRFFYTTDNRCQWTVARVDGYASGKTTEPTHLEGFGGTFNLNSLLVIAIVLGLAYFYVKRK